ncbi:MAG TPA: hypothetical protein PLG20_01030 [Candidatus Syntrophosphaera sp.]|nr:hypothetical protein [Candidatus Syntrophosphaera sp.]
MSHKFLLVLVALLVACAALSAEVQNSLSAIGLHFGTSTGSGYAMRWIGEKHGIQGTFGAYTLGKSQVEFTAFEDWDYEYGDSLITIDKGGRQTAANIGANYIYVLDKFKNGRVYIMGGGSYKYYQQKRFTSDYQLVNDGQYYNHYEPVPDTEAIHTKIEHRWTIGAGPGFEWAFSKQFRVAVEVPITFNWKHDIVMWIPQAGIYYYFK